MKAEAAVQNARIISRLKEDAHSGALHEMAVKDAVLHRMTQPEILTSIPSDCILSPRFCVEQMKEDGSTKLRPIDDFSVSGINGCAIPQEKLHYDSIDFLIMVLVALRAAFPWDGFEMWKVDIDSAYRRVPTKEDHSWLAHVCWLWLGSRCERAHS